LKKRDKTSPGALRIIMSENGMYKNKYLIVFICVAILAAAICIAGTAVANGDSILHSPAVIHPFYQAEDPSGDREGPPEPVGHASISVASKLVTLQVLVTDDKGNVITGLQPGNFTIYEDNVKQEITNFSPIEANITVVLLVEQTKHSSFSLDQHFIGQIYNILTSFVQKLHRGDWVGVIGYDIKPTVLCDFTQDYQQVLQTMKTFRFPAVSENNLFDAVIDTLDRTQEMEGKIAILLVSTGWNSFSGSTYDDVLNKCKSANAVIYAIGMGQYYRLLMDAYGYTTPEDSMDGMMADNRLRYISEYTGGTAYFPRLDSEVPAIIDNISVLLRSQYSIGYVSTNTKNDDKFRKIKVDVQADLKLNGKQVKFKVKTRKGYIPRPE
jgi:VWFA-related protein